tara:strand:- start:263 stop:496 length:234 start_codon:yes stop_codon:yes gene_type:complete
VFQLLQQLRLHHLRRLNIKVLPMGTVMLHLNYLGLDSLEECYLRHLCHHYLTLHHQSLQLIHLLLLHRHLLQQKLLY